MRIYAAVILLFTLQFYVKTQFTTSRHSFFQPNTISTIVIADGVSHEDRYTFSNLEAGMKWPASSPIYRAAAFASGIWIGAKIGGQLRLAAASYNSHFSPGRIPSIGQVPPVTVCNDSTWKVFIISLNDASLMNGGIRTKSAGGRTYSFAYTSWFAWPVTKGAPYAEINGIPGYQPSWNGDRPGIGNGSKARPDEICFTVYMDYTGCTNNVHRSELSLPGGTIPLGVEVHQISFGFSCPTLNNMFFVKYRVINKSANLWDSVFITLFSDPDIGNTSDDDAGCDSIRNLGFEYNGDNNDWIYGLNPPAIGNRFLQSPLLFTGNNSDTAKLPYDTLVGYRQLGMTSFVVFRNGGDSCIGDPNNAFAAYNFMKGKDGCGNPQINWVTGLPTKFRYSGDACNRIGWIDSIAQQRRELLNSGPTRMNSNDTQIFVIAQIITRDGGNNFQNVCALQSLSDSALKYYYNDFQTCIPIGIQPISSEVPERFALYQNYPNPFNPITKIKFALPPLPFGEGPGVRLIIYDLLGREIESLVNEQLQPGIYEIEWQAENYPSGVYFYQLTAPGFTQTNKMVLLK